MNTDMFLGKKKQQIKALEKIIEFVIDNVIAVKDLECKSGYGRHTSCDSFVTLGVKDCKLCKMIKEYEKRYQK